MTKNFRVMVSSFIMALTLTAPQLIHALETDFIDIPKSLRRLIIREAAKERYVNEKNPCGLALVCREWSGVISDEKQIIGQPCWKASYGVTPKKESIYQQFLNGVLIYRPDPDSDNGRIELPIRTLANPLDGTFDLSNCGEVGKYLSISTGYRKVWNPANAGKFETWFIPRFLVDQNMSNLAHNHHLRKIIEEGHWDAVKAPVGIFWTWGGWYANTDENLMKPCDYITNQSMEELGTGNLNEKWKLIEWPIGCFSDNPDHHRPPRLLKFFMVSFVNLDRD